MSPWPFLQSFSHYLNNYGCLLDLLFLHELWFYLVLFLNLVWYGPISRSMMHQGTCVFDIDINPFFWTTFNTESTNISRRIFFLLFVFGFTSLYSVLFGELFALFLSACSLIFLALLKLSFPSDLFSAMSDLVLMSFWRCIDFFSSSSFVWSSNLCMMLFFDSNSELVRLLSEFKS